MNLIEHFSGFSHEFHFIRPMWLVALIPLALLLIYSWRKEKKSSDWQSLIAPEFLDYLMDKKTNTTQSSAIWLIGILWLIASIALAGPSWNKRPTSIKKNQSALVILLDLSPSMLSQDLRPTRLARAKLKIADLLRERTDGLTALAVYSGDAHLVSPLSDDKNTLLNLLPSLDPQIMPNQGSNTVAAISLAIRLLNNAGAANGSILLITDGVVPDAFTSIKADITTSNYSLNILGVGTPNATPIATANGGYVRDAQGAIITTQLNSEILRSLTQQVSGNYYTISPDDSDVKGVMADIEHPVIAEKNKSAQNHVQRDFDQWYDEGFWLALLILPFLLYCFRRGFLSILLISNLLILSSTTLISPSTEANTLDQIFKTKDQQAKEAFDQGNHAAAAQEFENPEWRAAAKYKAGQFAEAAAEYAKVDNPQADYNRGNALAKAGKLQEAINAYDNALKRNPQLSDAKKNRDIVQSLLDQKNQEDKKNQQDKKDQKDEKDKKDEKNTKDQSKDGQSNDQNEKDQKQDDQKKENDAKNENTSKKDSKDGKQGSSQSNENSKQNSSTANSEQAEPDSNHGQSSSAQQNTNQQKTQSQSAQSSQNGAVKPMNQNQSSAGSKDAKDIQQAVDPYEAKMTPEEREAMQQWLRQVPDDPGGLLREKFKWQSIHNRENGSSKQEQNSNNNQQRW